MTLLQDIKIKAVTGAAVRRQDGAFLVLPTPSAVEIDRGIEQTITTARDQVGNLVDASITIDRFSPAFTLTFPFMTPELLAMQFGRQLEIADFGVTVDRTLTITTANQAYAGATTGLEGFGMVPDQPGSVAYVLNPQGISTMLTPVAEATFDPTVSDTFSQGTNGGYQFADNIAQANNGKGCTVAYSFPLDISQQPKLSEIPDLQFSITVSLIMQGLGKISMAMKSAQIDLTEGSVTFGGEVPVRFLSLYDGSSCQPIDIKFLGQTVAC